MRNIVALYGVSDARLREDCKLYRESCMLEKCERKMEGLGSI